MSSEDDSSHPRLGRVLGRSRQRPDQESSPASRSTILQASWPELLGAVPADRARLAVDRTQQSAFQAATTGGRIAAESGSRPAADDDESAPAGHDPALRLVDQPAQPEPTAPGDEQRRCPPVDRRLEASAVARPRSRPTIFRAGTSRRHGGILRGVRSPADHPDHPWLRTPPEDARPDPGGKPSSRVRGCPGSVDARPRARGPRGRRRGLPCDHGHPTRFDGPSRRRVRRSVRQPRDPTPGQHAQRAVGRGVAVLHEVDLVDCLPVRARACPPEGAWREQATAAHVPADRVLQPVRRARPRPVRGGRRHAPRGGDRPGTATGAGLRARPALGRGLPRGRGRSPGGARRSGTAAGRHRADRSRRRPDIRRGRPRPPASRRARSPARPGRSLGRLRRHRIRRTTSSSR